MPLDSAIPEKWEGRRTISEVGAGGERRVEECKMAGRKARGRKGTAGKETQKEKLNVETPERVGKKVTQNN